jgi:hypothetical protein
VFLGANERNKPIRIVKQERKTRKETSLTTTIRNNIPTRIKKANHPHPSLNLFFFLLHLLPLSSPLLPLSSLLLPYSLITP